MLYRVRDGCTFGHSDQHGPGALVELAEQEAAPFLDKLLPVADETGAGAGLDAPGEAAGDPSTDILAGHAPEPSAPAQDPPAAAKARKGRDA